MLLHGVREVAAHASCHIGYTGHCHCRRCPEACDEHGAHPAHHHHQLHSLSGWYEDLTQEKEVTQNRIVLSITGQLWEVCHLAGTSESCEGISADNVLLPFHRHGAGGIPVLQAFACDR